MSVGRSRGWFLPRYLRTILLFKYGKIDRLQQWADVCIDTPALVCTSLNMFMDEFRRTWMARLCVATYPFALFVTSWHFFPGYWNAHSLCCLKCTACSLALSFLCASAISWVIHLGFKLANCNLWSCRCAQCCARFCRRILCTRCCHHIFSQIGGASRWQFLLSSWPWW